MTVIGRMSIAAFVFAPQAALATTPSFSSATPIYVYNAGHFASPRVAISGTTAVVIADACTAATTTSICPAILYQFVNGQWVETARLFAAADESPPLNTVIEGPVGGFGVSVALSADGNTAFVGDTLAGCPAATSVDCGAVDVYVKPAGGWQDMQPTAQLNANSSSAASLGGRLLTIGNSVLATGLGTCLSSASTCAAVYVFNEPAGGWAATAPATVLTAPTYFGFLAAGALAYDAAASTLAANFGADQIFVFQGSSGSFASGGPVATLSGGDGSDALAISGGVIALGAPGSPGSGSGLVMLWVEPSGGWANMATRTATLSPSAPSSFSLKLQLGTGVVIDGNTVIASSAPGTLYIYQEPVSGWVSATENSQAALNAPGGLLSMLGSSLVETNSFCSGLTASCQVASIYPALGPGFSGPALILSAANIPAGYIQRTSSPIPVLLAGRPAEFDFEVSNVGIGSAGGNTLSIAVAPGTSSYSSGGAGCIVAGATATCPVGIISANASSSVAVMLTTPPKRAPFTVAAAVNTASQSWDPLDNQASFQAISDNPPVVPNNITFTSNNGARLSGTLPATDADGDTLTFTATQSPFNGTLTLAPNGNYTYAPASATFVGGDSFSYTVSDGLLTANGQVNVFLNPPPPPPPFVGNETSGKGADISLLLLGLLPLWRRSALKRRLHS